MDFGQINMHLNMPFVFGYYLSRDYFVRSLGQQTGNLFRLLIQTKVLQSLIYEGQAILLLLVTEL